MTDRPSIVIVSCSSTKPKSLIKLITKHSEIKDDPLDINKISHLWKIDTKYYTADVNVIGITPKFQRDEDFNDSVEALIIHMDSNKATGLDDLSIWGKMEDDCGPEVKLLVANYCNDETKITRAAATDWCLKRGFELIELYPSQTPQSDIIEEKFGVERIVEALETHTWSNMVIKNQNKNLTKEVTSESLEDFLEFESGDDFSDLFAQLSVMKESLQSLSTNQRKQCAEQVVTAFWRALDGDEEEIADI